MCSWEEWCFAGWATDKAAFALTDLTPVTPAVTSPWGQLSEAGSRLRGRWSLRTGTDCDAGGDEEKGSQEAARGTLGALSCCFILLCLHLLPSTCLEGRLNCTDLPCPGTSLPAGRGGEMALRSLRGQAWEKDYPAPGLPLQFPEAGARGQSGQRAPSPAGARCGPAPGPVPALLLSTVVLCALGRQGLSDRGRPAPAPPHAQVSCPLKAYASSPVSVPALIPWGSWSS